MRSNPSGSTNCLPHDLQRKFCLMRMFLLRWPFFTIESDLQKIHRLDIINHLREYIEPTYIYIIRLIDSIRFGARNQLCGLMFLPCSLRSQWSELKPCLAPFYISLKG